MSTPSELDARRLLDAASSSPPGVGEWVGPFELVEELGRGGHSAVFRARQHAPIAREVAVKILIDAIPSQNIAARFARERSLVARLRHPGIVPLIDAGEACLSGATVPWFAMPLVDGEPIDRWCGRVGASRVLRLRAIELVARAVQAAHALGVVHRDLKPANILISGTPDDPQIHVIDFGVAKLLDSGHDSDAAFATRVGGIVGTPEFMSPEQANLEGDRVAPQSDVYALGLLACLLLAGRLPDASDRVSRPMGERLRSAAQRPTPNIVDLARDRSLRGEVQWIVAKACAREIESRYANAGALADDLARLREGMAIVAAPGGSGYAGTYALRRYRVPIIATAVALAAVIASLTYLSAREAARAESETARNRRLSALLETARKELVPITGRHRGDLVDEAKAIPLVEMMHAINDELLGADADETQQSALVLARSYDRVDRFADAERIYRELLAQTMRDENRLGDRAYLRAMIAGSLRRADGSRSTEALELLDLAIGYWQSLASPPVAMCSAIIEKSFVVGIEGRHDEQRGLLEQAIACIDGLAPPGHMRRREARGFMGDFEREQGDFAAARGWYLEAISGLSESGDARVLAWMDAWRGETLWMECEEKLRAGQPIGAESLAQLRDIVERSKQRGILDARLPRWIAVIESLPMREDR